MPQDTAGTWAHWVQDRILRGLIWGLLRLPYRLRVPLCRVLMARVIAPLAGYRRRVRENLQTPCPACHAPN